MFSRGSEVYMPTIQIIEFHGCRYIARNIIAVQQVFIESKLSTLFFRSLNVETSNGGRLSLLYTLLKPQRGGRHWFPVFAKPDLIQVFSIFLLFSVPKKSPAIPFFKDFIYLFLEGRGREKERERNIDVREKHPFIASCTPRTGDLACNPGICSDWESNQQPFGLQNYPQSTESHQSGLQQFF